MARFTPKPAQGEIAKAVTPAPQPKPSPAPAAAEPDAVEPESVEAPSEPASAAIVAQPVAIQPAAQAAKPARYRVWAHGSLQCDFGTFQPGQEVPAKVAALGLQCVERIPD